MEQIGLEMRNVEPGSVEEYAYCVVCGRWERRLAPRPRSSSPALKRVAEVRPLSRRFDLLPEPLLPRFLCLRHSGILGQLMLKFEEHFLSDCERLVVGSSLGRRGWVGRG